MEITLDKKNLTESTLMITLESSDYQKAVEGKLKEYARKADIKGFRKGQVPLSFIKKRFGKRMLFEEVMKIASKALNEYIVKHQLPILTDPILDQEKIARINWEQLISPLELGFKLFTFEVENFELSKNIKVKHRKVTNIEEEVIDKQITKLQFKFGEKKEVTKSNSGDIIYGTFTHPSQKEPLAISITPAELSTKELESLFLDRVGKDVISIPPKDWFSIALKNTQQQESFFVKKILQENLPFIYTINRIVRPEIAALDQAFFDKAFGKDVVTSEIELRDYIKKGLLQEKENQSEVWLTKDIIEAILSNVVIHFPDAHMKIILRNILLKNKEITKEMLADEALLESYYKSYKADMQWDLVSRELAQKNDIKVTEEEIVAYVASHLRQEMQGQLTDDGESEKRIQETARMMLKSRNGEHYNQLYSRLLIERIILFIKEKITIESEEMSGKEFDIGFSKRISSVH